jgi:hypothetical protein
MALKLRELPQGKHRSNQKLVISAYAEHVLKIPFFLPLVLYTGLFHFQIAGNGVGFSLSHYMRCSWRVFVSPTIHKWNDF